MERLNVQISMEDYNVLIKPVQRLNQCREAFLRGRDRHQNMADNTKDFFENELWYEQTFKPFR